MKLNKLNKVLTLIIGGSFALSASVLAGDTVKSKIYAEVDGAVGGITYTKNERFIFSYHPFYNPNVKVGELLKNGKTIPFPNAAMQLAYKADGSLKNPSDYLNWVLGIRADGEGIVWILDSGQAEPRITPKLVAWNALNNTLDRIIYLPSPISLPESQHNDLAISHQFNMIVIADEGIGNGPKGDKAALVTVDLNTGVSRRVLQGHESVLPDFTLPIIMDAGTSQQKQMDVFIGADGIVLDRKEEWLYFAPLNKKYVYRIKMADIANTALSENELGNKVEQYAEKPNNGGLSIDENDNLYLTIVGERKIGVIPAATRKYRDYTSDQKMIWPDGVSVGPNGDMYTGAAQLPLSAPLNNGVAENKPPYLIYQFKPIAKGVLGR